MARYLRRLSLVSSQASRDYSIGSIAVEYNYNMVHSDSNNNWVSSLDNNRADNYSQYAHYCLPHLLCLQGGDYFCRDPRSHLSLGRGASSPPFR